MKGLRSFLVLATIALVTTQASSAEKQGPADPGLVYLRVTATNSSGQFIVGLAGQNFKISEDSMPQTIAHLSASGAPRVRVVLDGSRAWREEARAVASSVFEQGPLRVDELFLDESPELAPNEAVYQALNRLLETGSDGVRAVVLLTDRSDPSGYTFSKAKELLKDHDIQLHVIALSDPTSSPKESSRTVLRELATSSGGTAYFPVPISLVDAAQKIARDLHYQYLIGYRPTNAVKDGKWRKIKITAEFVDLKTNVVKKLNVRTKPGYYATAASTK